MFKNLLLLGIAVTTGYIAYEQLLGEEAWDAASDAVSETVNDMMS